MADSSEGNVQSTDSSEVKLKHVKRSDRGREKRGRPRKRRGSGDRAASHRGRGAVGTGKSRRQSTTDRESRRAEVEGTVDQRQTTVEEKIRGMEADELRETLIVISQEEPSLVHQVLARKTSTAPSAAPSTASSTGPASPPWCVYSRCREMPTEQERTCCGYRPVDCESQLPNFQLVCLDPEVLMVAQTYRRDFLANAPDRDPNREKRHTGYRQYILWKYGRLGEGVRIVILSCCVWAIRDRYPDAFGFYVGFRQGNIDL